MLRTRAPGGPSTLRARAAEPLVVVDAGRVDYGVAWAWQRELASRRLHNQVGDVVLLVEHPPTYTLGRRADEANLLLDDAQLHAAGIAVHHVDRGGDITYHGPGQVVGYPVFRLAGSRVVDHVRTLEQVNLAMLARHGIDGRRIDGLTGVWTDAGKVTAIGVRVTAGRITQHGWATNVSTDLAAFAGIVPCGIDDRAVTSMHALGVEADMATVIADTVAALGEVFATTVMRRGLADLGLDPAAATPQG